MHGRQARGLDKKQMVIGDQEFEGESEGNGARDNTPTIWFLFYFYLVWLSFTPKWQIGAFELAQHYELSIENQGKKAKCSSRVTPVIKTW
jgi:hypothetical protein